METAKIQPNNGFLDGKWFNVYCGISRCNSAIRALRKIDPGVNKNKDIRIAEMSVIRAHWCKYSLWQLNMKSALNE